MVALSKNIIKNLYCKEGLSTIQIAKKLDVSVWMVISFMRRNGIKRRTFFEANRINFDKKPLTYSIKKKLAKKDEDLKLSGVLLYWAEGAKLNGKNSCTVDFANSNPEMIRIFLKFLRKICGVDEKRLRVYLYCYSNQDIESIKKFWYNLTNIPESQFTKPYIRNDFLPEKSEKMKYGLAHIRYADKKLLIQIDDWIKEYCRII
jgi:hypothetical protein